MQGAPSSTSWALTEADGLADGAAGERSVFWSVACGIVIELLAGLLSTVATFLFNLPLPPHLNDSIWITRVGSRWLALRGVWEGDFAAKDLPVQRRKGVRRLRVNQAEKLQFVNVKVADGLHNWEFRHHLGRNRQ